MAIQTLSPNGTNITDAGLEHLKGLTKLQWLSLPDDDFDTAVAIAQAEFDQNRPDVVVGSSRGGAVAMNIDSGETPLVLLCPAWKRWGTATTVKPGVLVQREMETSIDGLGSSSCESGLVVLGFSALVL